MSLMELLALVAALLAAGVLFLVRAPRE